MSTERSIIKTFLRESNAIERVYDEGALKTALEAWDYIMSFDTIRLGTIAQMHYLLMFDLDENIAGRYRNCDVYIGGRTAPSAYMSQKLLIDWIEKYGDSTKLKGLSEKELEKLIKKAHIEYEFCHPFADGNGRTGRLLMNWQRMKAGLPVLVIHEGKEQRSYYDWFKQLK